MLKYECIVGLEKNMIIYYMHILGLYSLRNLDTHKFI